MMEQIARRASPDSWIRQIYAAKSATNGGVIRRRTDWVEREIGRERFEWEARMRGFHCIETSQQLIVICSRDRIRMLF